MTRELRTDLGVEVSLFVFVDREGERRMTIRVRDVFGSHVSVNNSPAAVAQLLTDAAETLAQHERLVRIGTEVTCAECERVTSNESRCVVCGTEPLCPYCIGAREHDCVRAGEVDG